MKPTPEESAAAHHLAQAILLFLAAIHAGDDLRREARRQVTSRPPSPAPVPPPQAVRPAAAPQPMPRAALPDVPDKMLLTAREASMYLSIGTRKLWELTAPRGPIPAVKIGRLVRYPKADLEDALEKMRVKPRKDSYS